MKVKLKVWRQKNCREAGYFEEHDVDGLIPDMSFLEMLDVVNDRLEGEGKEPIAFAHDCREGICGTCSLMVNGVAHGPEEGIASCQLYMRSFNDGDTVIVEPFRAKAFPLIKDLVVDRSALDNIIQSGGYVSVRTGSAPEANSVSVPKDDAELAMDAAACIGCGACVAACGNASAMLFVAAKVSHLNTLPQGKAEKNSRVLKMVARMDEAGFGNCTNQYECSAVCPKLISHDFIARMNRDYVAASLKRRLFGKAD